MSLKKNEGKQNKAYKYRCYPSKLQKELINKTMGCARFIYNRMLSDRQFHYQQIGSDISLTPADYKEEHPWLCEVDSLALCNAQLNLNRAYKAFFEKKSAFPVFKKKGIHDSYTTNSVNNSIRITENGIKMPKLGIVKIKQHRPIGINETIKGATISKVAGKYFVSVLVECYDTPQLLNKNNISTDRVLGLDYSSAHLYIDSNGYRCDHNRYYKNSQKNLAKAQRRLSKKQLKSKNYQKQLLKVQRIHRKITNQRLDALHKISNQITNDYDVICFEDINLNAMKQCLKLGKNTSDNGFGTLRTFVEYKAKNKGKYTVKVGKFFPSTKLCHCCGYKNKSITLSTREWTCPVCGTHHDRDYNAAMNIKKEGYRLLLQS